MTNITDLDFGKIIETIKRGGCSVISQRRIRRNDKRFSDSDLTAIIEATRANNVSILPPHLKAELIDCYGYDGIVKDALLSLL